MSNSQATSLKVLFTTNSLLRVFAIGLSFVTVTWLARELGKDFGYYGTLMYLSSLLTIPGTCGLNQSLTPYIATRRSVTDTNHLSGTVSCGLAISLFFSFLVILVAVPIKMFLYPGIDNKAFALALLTVPLIAFLQNCRAILQGLDLPVWASLVETFSIPAGTLLVLLTSHFIFGLEITLQLAFAALFTSAFISCCLACFLLKKKVVVHGRECWPEFGEIKKLFVQSLPFVFGQGVFAINSRVPLLLLATSVSETASGAYYTAALLANYVSFPLNTINPMISGRAANLYAQSETLQLKRLFQLSAYGCFFLSVPYAVVLIIFGTSVLELFNQLFVSGYGVLVILVIGQLMNVLAGSVGVLVTMTGHAKVAAKVAGLSTFVGITLCAILIPNFGSEGAAIGQAAGILVFNLTLLVFCIFHLGFNPSMIRSSFAIIR